MKTNPRFLLLASILLASAATAACGPSGNHVGVGTGGGTATNEGGGGRGGGGGAGGTGGSGGGNEPVSCSAAVPCSDDAYCDYADDRCGTGDETGTCRPRPHACSGGSAAQRCGCDGHLHEEDGSTEFNSCFVNLAGADLAVDGRCDMPGWLSCGSQLVEPGVEGFYCVTFPKRKGPEAQHALYLLDPSACDGIVTCDCFAAFVAAHPDEAPCASPTCAPDAAGHAMVTCP